MEGNNYSYFHYRIKFDTDTDSFYYPDFDEFLDYVSERPIVVDGVKTENVLTNFPDQIRSAMTNERRDHHGNVVQKASQNLYDKITSEIETERLESVTFAFDSSGNWQYAICVLPDRFNRRKGRWIAGGRLRKYGGVNIE